MSKKQTAEGEKPKRRLRIPKPKAPKAPKWLKKVGRVLKPVLVIFRPLRPLGRYVKGAWFELRQVVWPDRKSTLKLSLAVILFTALLTVFIVALDFGFEQLVKRILL